MVWAPELLEEVEEGVFHPGRVLGAVLPEGGEVVVVGRPGYSCLLGSGGCGWKISKNGHVKLLRR